MGQKTGKFETDMLFGLMYFRGILGVNLHINETLFLNESNFVFCAIMSKTVSDFSKTIFVLTAYKKTQLQETKRFAAVREMWEIFNSNL